MRKYFILLFCSLVIVTLSLSNSKAQSVYKGTKTNFNTNAKTDIGFSRSFVTQGTNYITSYKLLESGTNKQFGTATLTNFKTTNKIRVQLMIDKDTSSFEINYADSLGSVFGLTGPFKKEPVNKYPFSVAYLTSAKTYLKINQVIRKNTLMPEHFLLDRILGDDILLTTSLLSKIKPEPTGTANSILSMADFGVPNVIATTTTQTQISTTQQTTTTNPQNGIQPNNTTQTTGQQNSTVINTNPQNNIPSAPVKIKPSATNVKDFVADSIRVLLKPVENEMVSVQLFISGGVAGYPMAKQGIEAVALDWALNGGTKTLTPEQLQAREELLGISIRYKVFADYSVVSMNCLHKQFDECYQLFTDVITHPVFTPDQLSNSKDAVVAHDSERDPMDVLKQTALIYTFTGKQYDKNPEGDEISIGKLTADEIKKYYAALMVRKRIILVVTGDFTAEDLSMKMRNSFRSLPAGTALTTPSGGLDIGGSAFKSISLHDNSVNRIVGIASAPDAGSNDELALMLACEILNHRIEVEVTEKKNLTSDFQLSVAGIRQNLTWISLTSESPDKAIQAILDEVKKARKLGFTADELQEAKDRFITGYFISNQDNAALSMLLGKSEENDDWVDAENLYTNISNVALADVTAALRKYIKGFRFYYSGNPDDANEIIFTQKLD